MSAHIFVVTVAVTTPPVAQQQQTIQLALAVGISNASRRSTMWVSPTLVQAPVVSSFAASHKLHCIIHACTAQTDKNLFDGVSISQFISCLDVGGVSLRLDGNQCCLEGKGGRDLRGGLKHSAHAVRARCDHFGVWPY